MFSSNSAGPVLILPDWSKLLNVYTHFALLLFSSTLFKGGAMKINNILCKQRVHFCELNFRVFVINSYCIFKGLVHPKMKILSLITHPCVVPNPWDHSASEHKLRYFWLNERALWPCIESNATVMFPGPVRKSVKQSMWHQ